MGFKHSPAPDLQRLMPLPAIRTYEVNPTGLCICPGNTR